MFKRTKNGLSNENLFYDVEIIIYCEGVELQGEAKNLDEIFWARVFEANGKKVKCKSCGSKSNLELMAECITSNEISNVVVAMDRDYDYYLDKLIDHPQVIYTYGYSWESDVMLDFDFRVALNLFVNISDWRDCEYEFNCFRFRQSVILRRVFALDLKYICHSKPLFDRPKPMSIIECKTGKEPKVNIRKLLGQAKNFGRFQTVRLPRKTYLETCGVAVFYGKAVSHLIFHWFIYKSSTIAKHRKVTYEGFMNILLTTLPINDLKQPRNLYYSQLVAKFN